MSRFLKIIVHLVIFVTIIGVLAMVVPPFAGVNTTIVDSKEQQTNLPFGSVTYAKGVQAEALQEGDSIIVNQEGGTYEYEITAIDAAEGVYTLHDNRDANQEDQQAKLGNKIPRVILTVPFLGYLLAATQSVEGLIIIGLSILFLIILYIIAELWKKDPKKNAAEADGGAEEKDADGYAEQMPLKSKKQLRQEEKERALRMKEEERQMREDDKRRRKEEKKKKKAIRTGGFVDDLTEEEYYGGTLTESEGEAPVFAEPPKKLEETLAQVDAVMSQEELGKTQVILPRTEDTQETGAAEPAEEAVQQTEAAETEPFAIEQPAVTEAESKETETTAETEPAEEPVELKKMAVPVYTVAELHEKAMAAGENPDVYRDEISGVTLFDYTNLLNGKTEEQE